MSTNKRNQLRDLMRQAWQLVKVYGFTMAEAMRQSWMLLKLKKAMSNGIVKFFYQKINGEIRTAWGTLKADLIPETSGSEKKKNDSVMVYFDQEKQCYRSFKKANLLSIA